MDTQPQPAPPLSREAQIAEYCRLQKQSMNAFTMAAQFRKENPDLDAFLSALDGTAQDQRGGTDSQPQGAEPAEQTNLPQPALAEPVPKSHSGPNYTQAILSRELGEYLEMRGKMLMLLVNSPHLEQTLDSLRDSRTLSRALYL